MLGICKPGYCKHLRRGLGKPPGTAASMYPYVVPFLGDDPPGWREQAYYLAAALFAYHPASTESGNLGMHLARARQKSANPEALERRFVTLLDSHPEDLPGYLRYAVGFLKSKDIPINWQQLLTDIQGWSHPDRYIQKRWANSFWGRPQSQPEPSNLTAKER